jgi:hypothetical protein
MSARSFARIRSIGSAATFCSVVLGASSRALAFWPWWWDWRPVAHPTPEIDPGLIGTAAAIVVGGLLVLRGRRRSS